MSGSTQPITLAGFCSLLLIVTLISGCGTAPKVGQIDSITAAEQRVRDWLDLIREKKSLPTLHKLTTVNNFINRLRFQTDTLHWKESDFWATPFETLITNGGDCEDLAIAKYFLLKALEVPENTIRLTYVTSDYRKEGHIVLTYHQGHESDPLVLDNVDNKILPLSWRTDYESIYSFNNQSLWLASKHGKEKLLANAAHQIRAWNELLERLTVQQANFNGFDS